MRPSRDETSMALARVMAERGTCERAKVGVVISLHGRVLCTGYNGAPPGLDHCLHTCTCGAGRYEGEVASGIHIGDCDFRPSNHCEVAVHAEANAIAWAARHGISLEGADLFTTLAPCMACAKLIAVAGIKRVQCGREYKGLDGLPVMEAAGIEIMYPAPIV